MRRRRSCGRRRRAGRCSSSRRCGVRRRRSRAGPAGRSLMGIQPLAMRELAMHLAEFELTRRGLVPVGRVVREALAARVTAQALERDELSTSNPWRVFRHSQKPEIRSKSCGSTFRRSKVWASAVIRVRTLRDCSVPTPPSGGSRTRGLRDSRRVGTRPGGNGLLPVGWHCRGDAGRRASHTV